MWKTIASIFTAIRTSAEGVDYYAQAFKESGKLTAEAVEDIGTDLRRERAKARELKDLEHSKLLEQQE